MSMMILLLIGAHLIHLCSTNALVHNISFDLSLIFHHQQLCIDHFGTSNDTKYTLESMDDIFMFEWDQSYNIIDPNTSLVGSLRYVNCSTNNAISTTTNFVWVCSNYSNVNDILNQYFIDAAISLKEYFNGDPTLIFSNQKIISMRTTTKIAQQSNATSCYAYLFYALLALSLLIALCICIYLRRQCKKAFVVDKALVLIVGISHYDDLNYLPGVSRNVKDLEHLWSKVYKYDVVICKPQKLYCTKLDINNFIDESKKKIEEQYYNAAIIHVLGHKSEYKDSIVTSDMKHIQFNFFQHELVDAAENAKNHGLLKLIFIHACRGEVDYHDDNGQFSEDYDNMPQMTDDNVGIQYPMNPGGGISHRNRIVSPESNCVKIYGNINDRALSDKGNFTDTICEVFSKNVRRILKHDLRTLFVQIGIILETKTRQAEILTTEGMGTIRYSQIRFVKSKNVVNMESYYETKCEQTILEEEAFLYTDHNSGDGGIRSATNHRNNDSSPYTSIEMYIPEKNILLSTSNYNRKTNDENNKSIKNAEIDENAMDSMSSNLNPNAKEFVVSKIAPSHLSISNSLETISEEEMLIEELDNLKYKVVSKENQNQNRSQSNDNPMSNSIVSDSIQRATNPKKKKKKKNTNTSDMHTRTNCQPDFNRIETKQNLLYISNALMKNIKNRTLTKINGVDMRKYMNTIFEIHYEKKCEQDLKLIDFGFIDDKNGNSLCCTISQQQSEKYKHKLNDDLVFSNFNLSPYKDECKTGEYIQKIKDCINAENIFENCIWKEIQIIFRKNNKFRITANTTKEQFLSDIKSFNTHKVNVLPILSPDNTIDFAWIVKIHEHPDIYVAVSLEYDKRSGNIKVNGIQTDKKHLLLRHYLVHPPHINECECLNEFESMIHDINVGSTDIWLNKVRHYEGLYKK